MNRYSRVDSYLADMLEHAQYAVDFVAGSDRPGFENDRQKQFAVVRALEVVGEAAKMIPSETRELAPSIPWKEITAMRDKLIHHYFGVDLEILWETASKDVPALISELEKLLARLKLDELN